MSVARYVTHTLFNMKIGKKVRINSIYTHSKDVAIGLRKLLGGLFRSSDFLKIRF
jgi:hypothetical protein